MSAISERQQTDSPWALQVDAPGTAAASGATAARPVTATAEAGAAARPAATSETARPAARPIADTHTTEARGTEATTTTHDGGTHAATTETRGADATQVREVTIPIPSATPWRDVVRDRIARVAHERTGNGITRGSAWDRATNALSGIAASNATLATNLVAGPLLGSIIAPIATVARHGLSRLFDPTNSTAARIFVEQNSPKGLFGRILDGPTKFASRFALRHNNPDRLVNDSGASWPFMSDRKLEERFFDAVEMGGFAGSVGAMAENGLVLGAQDRVTGSNFEHVIFRAEQILDHLAQRQPERTRMAYVRNMLYRMYDEVDKRARVRDWKAIIGKALDSIIPAAYFAAAFDFITGKTAPIFRNIWDNTVNTVSGAAQNVSTWFNNDFAPGVRGVTDTLGQQLGTAAQGAGDWFHNTFYGIFPPAVPTPPVVPTPYSWSTLPVAPWTPHPGNVWIDPQAFQLPSWAVSMTPGVIPPYSNMRFIFDPNNPFYAIMIDPTFSPN